MSEKHIYKELEKKVHEIASLKSELKQTGEALKESEKRFRALLENMPGGVIAHDLDGKILFANDLASHQTGCSKEDLCNMFIQDIDPTAGIKEKQTKIWQDLNKGKAFIIENEITRKDGLKCVTEIHSNATMLDGKPAILAIAFDITERKQTEKQLASRLEFERLISTISSEFMGLYYDEIDGGIDKALASITKFTGASRAFIYQFHDDEKFADNTHEYCAPGLLEQKENYQNISIADKFPWIFSLLQKNKIIHIPDISDLPSGAKLERNNFGVQGIKSLMVVPMRLGDRLIGFLGFDILHDRKTWTDEDQAILRLVGEIFTNAIGRKKSEKEREILKAQLSSAVEMAHLGYWEFDNANELFTFNDHFYKIFHTSIDKVGKYKMSPKEYFKRFVHPDDVPAILEESQKGLKSRKPSFGGQVEHRIFYEDGAIGHVVVRDLIIKDDKGNIIKTFGVTQDITDRKKAEEALRESEERFRKIFEDGPIGVILTSRDLDFISANSAFCQMVGYTTEEMDTKTFLKIQHPEHIQKDKENMEKLWNGAISHYKTVKQYITKNGNIKWGSISISLIRAQDGNPIYALAMVEDITEKKQAEKKLKESEEKLIRSKKMESLGLLAGGVAHDLNNVLSGIVSYPELLLIDLPEDSKLRKPLEMIKKSGEQAAAIVEDLLTIARGVASEKKPLNINSIIKDYLSSPEFFKLEKFHPFVEVKSVLDHDIFNIIGSDSHIRKIIMNLVSNASEAIENHGDVIISTRNCYLDKPIEGYENINSGEYVVLSILDTGSGIEQNHLKRILEPFFTRKVMGRSGTGLGLTVVWNIVRDHDGYINILSGKQGTTFELYFPISRNDIIDNKSHLSIKELKGNRETILVVDDVASQREISCAILNILNYQYHAVSSGEEAIEYLKEKKVDLVLLDMVMEPGISGLEAYKRIIKIHSGQKAIIVSGFAETEDVKETQKMGAGQYVKKPFTIETIGAALKKELI